MENSKEKLYDETMEAKADIVMKAIGKRLIEQEQKEFDTLLQESKDFKVPDETHAKVYEVIKDHEYRTKLAKRKVTLRRVGRVCAILFVAVGISSVVFINNADAFKYHFKNFLVERNPEYITLFPKEDISDSEEISVAGLWCPEYLPEGFQLVDKVERSLDVVFVFKSDKGQELQLYQSSATNIGISMDNEGDAQGEVKIQDKYDGYWTSTEGNTALLWVQGDQLLEIYADIEREEIFKVADSVAYQT